MADRRIVQCTAAFHVGTDSGPLVVGSGDLYFADDPIVKGREHHFSDVNVRSSVASTPKRTAVSSSATEEATATPGRRRSLTRKDDKPEPEGPKDEAPKAEQKDSEV